MSPSNDAPRLFGTDGVRAPFGEPPLVRETVTTLGFHLGRSLVGPDPLVLVGGDTRESTPTLARWIGAGLEAAGVRSLWLGTVPTPAVAYLVADLGADAGVVVSASHNLPPDNGIKLFDRHGHKWSSGAERSLEEAIEAEPVDAEDLAPAPLELEGARIQRYLRHLIDSIPGDTPLKGTSVILDCANGATSPWAEGLFRQTGAELRVLAASPDGTNINRHCGSTHPERLQREVREHDADFGFAFDGDGDRCLLVDERGDLRDGDFLLYRWALALQQQDLLEPPELVATSMSNLGLERALRPHGIEVIRCGVGDRTVVSTMRKRGAVLGGEQSGHIVSTRYATTGDGLLTALQMAAILAADGRSASEQLRELRRFPQLLENVPVERKIPFEAQDEVLSTVERIEAEMGDEGRLVLRYSGTEPLARIMVEGPEPDRIRSWADALADAIRRGQSEISSV